MLGPGPCLPASGSGGPDRHHGACPPGQCCWCRAGWSQRHRAALVPGRLISAAPALQVWGALVERSSDAELSRSMAALVTPCLQLLSQPTSAVAPPTPICGPASSAQVRPPLLPCRAGPYPPPPPFRDPAESVWEEQGGGTPPLHWSRLPLLLESAPQSQPRPPYLAWPPSLPPSPSHRLRALGLLASRLSSGRLPAAPTPGAGLAGLCVGLVGLLQGPSAVQRTVAALLISAWGSAPPPLPLLLEAALETRPLFEEVAPLMLALQRDCHVSPPPATPPPPPPPPPVLPRPPLQALLVVMDKRGAAVPQGLTARSAHPLPRPHPGHLSCPPPPSGYTAEVASQLATSVVDSALATLSLTRPQHQVTSPPPLLLP